MRQHRLLRTTLMIYWALLLPALLLGTSFAFHIVRALGLAIALGIVVAFAKAFWTWWTAKYDPPVYHGFAAGIFLFWFGVTGHLANNVTAQFYHDPPAFVHSIVGIGSLWVAMSGGLLMLLSSEGVDHGTLVSPRGLRTGIRITAALFVALGLLFLLGSEGWWNGRPVVEWISRHLVGG